MTVNSIAANQLQSAMTKLSTMQKVNSAADDASGLAIAQKIESQIRGLDQGIDNTLDMQNLVRTAEGGLSAIDDGLQRIRELSVQASNGIYNDSDRAILQNEIEQLKQGINDVARNTQFNAQNLLDGSFANKNTASYPNGTGATVSIPDMTMLGLGLQSYDVSQAGKTVQDGVDANNVPKYKYEPGFDIGAVDRAMASVSEVRSYLGAMDNRFDHTVNSNSITMLNQAAAKSRIVDLDVAKGVTDLERARILNETQIYMQKTIRKTRRRFP